MIEFPHNQYAFGLGYTPTVVVEGGKGQNKKRWEVLQREEVSAKNPQWMFVREGEDFPFCGFTKTWEDETTKQRYPGLLIFFDKNGMKMTVKKGYLVTPTSRIALRCWLKLI